MGIGCGSTFLYARRALAMSTAEGLTGTFVQDKYDRILLFLVTGPKLYPWLSPRCLGNMQTKEPKSVLWVTL